MTPTQTHYDLLDAFDQTGCPICWLCSRAVHRYIESVDYEYVNAPGFREKVEPAWGFCNFHARQWLAQAHVLGTALIYITVLERISIELKNVRPARRNGLIAAMASLFNLRNRRAHEPAYRALQPTDRCPICLAREEQESVAIVTLLEDLAEPSVQEAFRRSAGLCLPHLRSAFEAGAEGVAFVVLRGHALATQERLKAQLHEIVRHHDYRFQDTIEGAERGSAERAVLHVSGASGIRGA